MDDPLLWWFAIGCVLPIVSFFILFGMISWNEKTTPRHKLSRREQAESNQLVQQLIHSFERGQEREKEKIRNLITVKPIKLQGKSKTRG